MWREAFLCLMVTMDSWFVHGYVTVTLHPEFVSQNGRSHFEVDRWNGHNGLDTPGDVVKNKAIGTESGRWLNQDYRDATFQHVTEDPHHKGYPDPAYFNNRQFEEKAAAKFLANLKEYRFDLDLVMELKGQTWPHWMDTSKHGGKFPNNLDAAADMVVLFLEAINRHTGGHMPPYFEIMNEPDSIGQDLDWTTVINYHKTVADKLRKHFPKMKIGGPTLTGTVQKTDRRNFFLWSRYKPFLDMSLNHLDFFSFHAYNSISLQGGHKWGGINEARLVAFVDMIQNHAIRRKGRHVPLVISEYGLGNTGDAIHSELFGEWAHSFSHNSLLFTFLGIRGFIDRAVAFLLSNSELHPPASILHKNLTYTNVAKAFQFWQHFRYSQQFLRVEDEFKGSQRLLSSLAVADPHTKEITVLLQNYHTSSTIVKLNFLNRWAHANTVNQRCFYLGSHQIPVLTNTTGVSFGNNQVSVPAESTCYFVIKSLHNFGHTPTLQEHTSYSSGMVLPIHGHSVNTSVSIHNNGTIKYANLRIGVSMGDKTFKTRPKTVKVNQHVLTLSYALYQPGKDKADTLWDVYIYHVPVQVVKQAANSISLEFVQDGGFVSTVALIVGAQSSSEPSLVG